MGADGRRTPDQDARRAPSHGGATRGETSASRASSGQKIGAATQHDAKPASAVASIRFSTAAPERQQRHAPLGAPAPLVGVAVEAVPGEAAEHERRGARDLAGATRRPARRRARARPPSSSRSRRQRSPIPSASRCLASAVSTTTQRHGREWCGAGAMHAASTSSVEDGARAPARQRRRGSSGAPRGTRGRSMTYSDSGQGLACERGRDAAIGHERVR